MPTKKQSALTTLRHKKPGTNATHTELIWCYWTEQSMLEQVLSTILQRFQNGSETDEKNPLKHLDIDPLRPLNNLFWGYIQDEQHRLSVRRRSYEYDHHYGISLKGEASKQNKAKPSDFQKAWDDLLEQVSTFLKPHGSGNKPDKTKLLSQIRKVQQVLTRQSTDADPKVSRQIRREMQERKKLLARPELQIFLGIDPPKGSFQKRWTSVVDKVKALAGWDSTPSIHYQTLAATAERLLLSIRFGDWNTAEDAAEWIQDVKNDLRKYIRINRLLGQP